MPAPYLKGLLTKSPSPYRLALLLAGTLVFLVHFYLQEHPRLAIAAESVGLSIIITTLVTTFVNLSFERGIYSSFEIIRGCTDAEITNIYPTRKDAIGSLEKEVRGAKTLDIMAVAGTDFFNVQCDVINRIDASRRENRNQHVRVLLLDPRSYFAVERCLLEERVEVESLTVMEFNYPDKKLCRDIMFSLAQLEGILTDRKKDPHTHFVLEVRTYNEAPQFMCVRIDDIVFAEAYHKGTSPPGQNDSSLRKCLGKTVPIIRTTVVSNLGHILEAQFERLWTVSKKRSFEPGCLAVLRKELMQESWVARFQERYHNAEQALEIKKQLAPAKPSQVVPAAQNASSKVAGT